jgi:hypothetical protein
MKHHRRFAHALILIIFVAGVIGLSGAQATSTDLVELHIYAPSIDGSVWFARGDGARWRSPCPNSGQPSHGRCLVRVERGTTVILTPQDGAISKFQRWEQPCNVTGTTCTVQVNEDVVHRAVLAAAIMVPVTRPRPDYRVADGVGPTGAAVRP